MGREVKYAPPRQGMLQVGAESLLEIDSQYREKYTPEPLGLKAI